MGDGTTDTDKQQCLFIVVVIRQCRRRRCCCMKFCVAELYSPSFLCLWCRGLRLKGACFHSVCCSLVRSFHFVLFSCHFSGEKYLNDLYNADDLTVNMGTLIFRAKKKCYENEGKHFAITSLPSPCMSLHHHKTHCNCIVCDLNCAFHNKQQ